MTGPTMRAYRIGAWQEPARLVQVPVPEPRPDQVRVRVAACGLCHSDLAMAQMPAEVGEAIGWSAPFTLGHETAGWIDAVGADVRSAAGSGPDPGAGSGSGSVASLALAEGEPVALVSPSSCGGCRWCLRGQENACLHGLVGRGYGRDGGLAEYVVVDDPWRSLVPLGRLDPYRAGPLTDAGATAHHAVRRVAGRVGDDGTVVVLGVGGLGAFVVQLARVLTAARVVAVDPNPDRRDLALDLGAHHVVAGVDDQTRDQLTAVVGGEPVDAVIDLVGSDATIELGARTLSPGGALAIVGAAGGTLRRPWFGTLPRDGEVFTFQGSDLADVASVVALAAEGRVRVDIDPFSLNDVDAAYEALETGVLKGRAVVAP